MIKSTVGDSTTVATWLDSLDKIQKDAFVHYAKNATSDIEAFFFPFGWGNSQISISKLLKNASDASGHGAPWPLAGRSCSLEGPSFAQT